MVSQTVRKFGYPDTLIKEYKNWLLLLRPKQVTLGSLVLICKDPAKKFSEITADSFKELSLIIPEIEGGLYSSFEYDRINYLMLMMVDPDVHFHIIPRHKAPLKFKGKEYTDPAWPGPADLNKINDIKENDLAALKDMFLKKLPAPGKKKYGRIYTTGCFDFFHIGHLNILKRSKELCDHLLVGVSTDELIRKEKKKAPIIPFEQRIEIVRSLKFVDQAIPQTDKDKQRIIDEYRIDAITVGDDWKGKYPKVSCEVIYFPYTKEISTGEIREKLLGR